VAAVRPGDPPDGSFDGSDNSSDDGFDDSSDAVDMNRCLADHGVTLVAIPRLLVLLHESGFTGITPDELAGTVSLGRLAATLEPLPPRAHCGGEASP
jgi:hypothetical protein